MPINFPNSPSLNEIYSYDNKTWEWNGIYWEVYSALTSYITSAYTSGDGVSDISGVTNGNLVLKSFSGVGLTITDSGDKLTFISSGSYLPTSGGTVTGNTIFTSGLTATTLDVVGNDARINTLTIGLGAGQIFNNTAVGTQALLENTTGAANTAVGYFALENNTTGSNNSAFGYASLLSNLTSSNHTAIGLSSLRNITGGSYNTAFGNNAGRYIADGVTNATTLNTSVFIGANTRPLANSQTNQIVIGYDATGLGSNSVVLGNSGITLTALRGNVLINTTTDAGYRLDVSGSVRTTGTISASTAIARGTYLNQTLVATANNDVLVGLDIQPTFTTGAFTGVAQIGLRVDGSIQSPIIFGATYLALSSGASTQPISFYLNQTSTLIARFFGTTGNLLLQNGGTFTDSGFRLDVNGNTKLRNDVRLGSISQPSAPTLTTNSTTGGTLSAATYYYRIVAVDFFGSTTTASNELSVTTTGSTSSISLAWSLVSGAYSYRIYRGTTSSGQNTYYTVNGTNTTSFTDTGAAGTAGTTPTENLTAYGSYSTSNGAFRSGNITIVNNGVGNTSQIVFDKTTDAPAINVVEYASDSTMFEFSLRDNPDGVGDFFHWVLPDWQNPSSGWKPLKFSNLELQFIGSTSNFWSSFSLPSSTPYYTTNPDSLANSSIKWNPYTSNTYNLIKDAGTGTGNLNVEISGFTGTINRIYWVTIQAVTSTFNWGINSYLTAPIGTGVAITGGWQTLDNGTQIRITGAVLAGDRWSFRAFPVPRLGVGTTTPTSPLQVSSIARASGAIATGVNFNPTLVATANNDTLVGLDIAPTFTTGAFSGVQQENLVIRGGNAPIIRFKNASGTTTLGQIVGTGTQFSINAQSNTLSFVAGNTEAVNIFSSTRNVLIQNGGTFTDAGFRLDVNGTARIQNQLTTTGSISASAAVARGTYLNQTLVATANNDTLVGLDIQPTFTNGAFSGVTQIPLRIGGNTADQGITFSNQNWMIRSTGGSVNYNGGVGFDFSTNATTLTPYRFLQGFSTKFMIAATTGNILVNTTTDVGYRLDVNGTGRFVGTILSTGAYSVSSGTYDIFGNTTSVVPTSGNMVVNGFAYNSTINQTGGASGITRGLYINPTLTSAADFRAIETTIGNVMLNTVSGNTLIGTTANTGTYKLDVRGATRFSASTGTSLTVISSGNSTSAPVFSVQGSQGELFSVTDSLTGSLFSVNDISGLPILEVFSDSTTIIGDYQAPSLYTTKRVTSITASTGTTIYSFPVSAYTSAFVDYYVTSATGMRAGNMMAIWSGTTVQSTQTSTSDIGNTSPVTFGWRISGSSAVLSASASTGTWTVESILRGL